MLAIDRLVVDIDTSRILRGISLQVAAGQLVCLVGRNGAGKTTTFRTIMGMIRPVEGTIAFDGASMVGLPTYRIAQLASATRPRRARCSAT